jgi:hypothetical protein
MKRHKRTFLKVEELEQRDVPSTGLPGTETMHLTDHNPPIAQTSFQWGIGRGVNEAKSMTGPVEDIRLRRIVMDVVTPSDGKAPALPGASLAVSPMESVSFNF